MKEYLEIYLKEKGINTRNNFKCIVHNWESKNNSMSYHNNHVKCFSCGFYGDIYDVIKSEYNLNFFEANKKVNEMYNGFSKTTRVISNPKIEKHKEIQEAFCLKGFAFKFLKYDDPGTRYLEKRGISYSTICKFKLMKDKYNNILFPFFKDNKITSIQIRTIINKPGMPKSWYLKDINSNSGKKELYNIDNIDKNKKIFITEGLIDCLTLYEVGFKNCVSIPNGVKNLNWINDNEWLKKSDIIVCGDNDQAGLQFNVEVKQMIMCKFFKFYNNDINDLNEYLLKNRSEFIENLRIKYNA